MWLGLLDSTSFLLTTSGGIVSILVKFGAARVHRIARWTVAWSGRYLSLRRSPNETGESCIMVVWTWSFAHGTFDMTWTLLGYPWNVKASKKSPIQIFAHLPTWAQQMDKFFDSALRLGYGNHFACVLFDDRLLPSNLEFHHWERWWRRMGPRKGLPRMSQSMLDHPWFRCSRQSYSTFWVVPT